MNRKILSYLEIAGKLASSKNDQRHFILSAIAIRSDGAIVKSINSPVPEPNRVVHAEYKVCKKIDAGATVYVARIKNIDGKQVFAMARPCHDCMKLLKSKKVKRVYYTIGSNEFGTITF